MLPVLLLLQGLTMLLATSVHGGPTRVTSLPGWNGPLPSAMYSGYVDIRTTAMPGQSMYMHYVLIEAENANPATAPTIVWHNGGPGASSLWGLMVELGPILLNDDSILDPGYNSTGIPQFQRNVYGWTKYANVIAFDNPPPVGFSYCTPPGPGGDGTACGVWNDTRVGQTNAEAIYKVFTEQFPGRYLQKPKSLFVIGESYAGVYVPVSLQALVENPQYSSVASKLGGVALGDACLGTDVLCGGKNGIYYDLLFLYGHAQFSTESWNDVNTKCTMAQLKGTAPMTPQCKSSTTAAVDSVGSYYAYNLYDNCPDPRFRAVKHRPGRSNATTLALGQVAHTFSVGYVCPGEAFFQWVNLSSVRSALGVPQDKYFFMADNGGGMQYVYNEKNVLPFLNQLMNAPYNVRLLIYNGDTDPSINSFITQDIWYQFASQQNYQRTESWRPWTMYDGSIVGGYVTEWLNGTLAFLTIRGSGHMVPEFQPVAASTFLGSWVTGSEFPRLTEQKKKKRQLKN